ncbi:M28 family peptidase [Actinomadura syzygii]|uniref:M28 family peptidase n=1 Tax=Actinomadura syzygii TaxID=1427538 RepID=A0A5D0ULC5_9ACTN|nr:M28 family peptidase [Actinomadura syzygii]TYC18626.1 M28 family peptidase [Actinomadura syzygii]
MKRKPILAVLVAAALVVAGLVPVALRALPNAKGATPDPKTAAVASAERVVAGRVAELHPSKFDGYVRTQVTGTPWGLNYVAYERTYRGLPVVGGDFVVATDDKGQVRNLSVAQKRALDLRGVTPKVGKAAALRTSRAALTKPDKKALQPRLVVHALAKPRLAWETTVSGRDGKQPSLKKVYVDALTGKRFAEQELIYAGTGTGIWEGSNLNIGTTQSGSQYTMRDPQRSGITCADLSTNQVFSGPDDVWGSTSKTSKEAGCVDVMYASAGEWDLLKSFGRNGLNGSGQWYPALVGLDEVNAYWNGSNARFGHNNSGQWITATDVVAHEFGHGLDNFTPGGISGGGTQEFVGDVWGAATEAFLNNPTDKPDYTVGEMINLTGSGPIRNMYQPSLVNNDPNCYSSSVPNMEVHKAAGPGNHWFYLLAEGNNPGGGKPTSPICSGGPSSVTGIGIMNAAKIFYNAMAMKTSGTNYGRYRVLTLSAAKNLDPSCNWYNKVKDAWNAVTLGAQSGEPTCTPSGSDFSLSVSPNSGSVKPGASVQATVNTTVASGTSEAVDLTATVSPANSGLTATFSPSTVNSGSTSALTIAASDAAKTGPFTVTVTGKGRTNTHTATYNLTVEGGGNPGTGNPPDVNVENVKAHLQQLQNIATQNGGTRYATSGGYTASVSYIEQKLQAAGFTVSRQTCASGCTAGAGPNLIADWPGGNANNVYMFGAHLDSVRAGPGVNDNGSGSAALLETALTLAQSKPSMLNHVRFGWWTDEEQGLKGSTYYVNQLPSTERSKIKGYFNFDMVGSPNPGYFIAGVNSALSANLKGYFDSINIVPDEMSECCSDDGPFRNAGIQTSFLSTGADAVKTTTQAQKWGGTAGQSFDRCYHQSCDSYPSNINTTGLDRSADAIAWALWKTSVNSTPTDDFSLTADPSSASVQPGQSATATVSTAVTAGAAQPVDLTATVSPGGPKVTFNPASIQAGGRSTMTVATTSDTPAGDYNVTVTGTGKSASHTVSFTLSVKGAGTDDFSVSVDPSTSTVEAGKPVTATVRTTLTGGSAQQVALSATVSPSGPTATVDPGSVQTGGSATLNVATTSSTPEGSYTVTVTGKGSVTRTATFTLSVTKPTNGRTASSDTQYPLDDYTWTVSPLQANVSGQAAYQVTLSIDVDHTCMEDLGVWLVSPAGQTYQVKRQGSGQYECTAWNGPKTFYVPGVSSQASGTWQLYFYDYGPGDTGTLNGWSVTL